MEDSIFFEFKNNKFVLKGTNAGYTIVEHNEVKDTDGSMIGIALAKSSTQYVTWRFTFFPKSEYFSGFNHGHYFINELSAKKDYFDRSSEMCKNLITRKVQMNKLKAQLIKSMQTDLDELKKDLLKMQPQEILGRAYEYAMKTEIIYAAHDSVLDDHQIKALLKHPSPLNDVYSKYLKHDETSLSDELANCLAEEANVELHHNENTEEKRHEEYSDAFFIDNGLKRIVWIYYNPDSNAGGQYVTNIISFDKLAEISSISRNADDYFNTQISSLCTQYLSDVGTDYYKAAERMFYDNPDFVNTTYTTMQALTNEWENDLHNDLPSFIKSAFAWDELIGYGSIDDEIQYEETPVKVVRDFFLKEKGTMYSYEGEYTDCIWNLEERDGKPVINIAVKRENESKPLFSFDKTFEWNDITNAVIARIQQEKIYNKLVEHCYKFSKYHTDDYRVYDPEEGRTVIRGSAEQIKERFGKLLNKQEVKMLIETEIVPALAKADEQFEVDCENDDMEI